jgi:hypothetical protein
MINWNGRKFPQFIFKYYRIFVEGLRKISRRLREATWLLYLQRNPGPADYKAAGRPLSLHGGSAEQSGNNKYGRYWTHLQTA